MSKNAVIYYGDYDESFVGRNSLGDNVYFISAEHPDLVPVLQEQGAHFWPTVWQTMGEDEHVSAEQVAEWLANNPQF